VNILISFLNHLLPVLLGTAWVNYSVYFVRRDPFAQRTATPFLVVTIAFQVAYIVLLGIQFRHHLMANFFEVLTVIALSLSLVYLAIETVHKNKSMGVFILPIAFLAQLAASSWITPSRTIDPILRDPLFGFHTGSIALAYAAFLIAAVYGVMYLVFYRSIQSKRFGLIFERLPSLDVLARMTLGATAVGFLFLGLALLFGAAWAARIPFDFRSDPKFLLTLVVWVVYGVPLVGHYLLRWGERRNVSISLAAFLLALLSFASLNFLLPTFHDFGG